MADQQDSTDAWMAAQRHQAPGSVHQPGQALPGHPLAGLPHIRPLAGQMKAARRTHAISLQYGTPRQLEGK